MKKLALLGRRACFSQKSKHCSLYLEVFCGLFRAPVLTATTKKVNFFLEKSAPSQLTCLSCKILATLLSKVAD